MSDSTQTSVHIKITVDPAHAETFLNALKPVFTAVIAEPRNTFFEVYQDEQNPGVFKLVENWTASVEYMKEVQVKKGYYEPYRAAIMPLLLKPLEAEFYTRMPGNEWVNVRAGIYPDRS